MSPERSEFKPKAASEEQQQRERQYTLSISEEARRRSFEIEDERWARDKQVKDWLKLGLMVAITLLWNLLVFFLQPGLK